MSLKKRLNLAPLLAALVLVIGVVDFVGLYWGLHLKELPISKVLLFHSGAIIVGALLILAFRKGVTFAFFSVLLCFLLPVAGFLATALILISCRKEKTVDGDAEPWVIGNPSRYRPAPDAPGEPLEAGDRGKALWLRHAKSRAEVESLKILREQSDPFTSLYASGALETQLGHLENRISGLREQVKANPDDVRSQQHLAEALIHQVQLQDPRFESVESVKSMTEAKRTLSSLGGQSPVLEKMEKLRSAEEKVRLSYWKGVASVLPKNVHSSVRDFWMN